jgi:hypothetical protein
MASIHNDAGDYAAAEARMEPVLAVFRAAFPEGHYNLIKAEQIVVDALMGQARYAEAKALVQAHYAASAPGQPGVTMRASVLGYLQRLYAAWGRPDEAARYAAERTAYDAERAAPHAEGAGDRETAAR